MRKIYLSLLFLFFCFGIILAQKGQPTKSITIQRTKISVKRILLKITAQSGMEFSYNPKSIDVKEKISFHIKRATLIETLEQLSTKIPIEYHLVENQIVLNYKKKIIKEQSNKQERKLEGRPIFYTLSGFLSDKKSGESLIGASVFIRGGTRGTTTNAFGFYSLRLPKGKYTIEYSYIGFNTQSLTTPLNKNIRKNINLQYAQLDLPSVIVKIPLPDFLDKKQLGKFNLKAGDLESMPEFGGESGLIKGLQALPGLKSHSDGSAFFFARGGEKDQNLIIMDDAPIYNPAHLFGFYSIVIPDFTKDITVYKSDIPVNLGDRLSSIIDIRTKDGNLNNFEFNAAFNPLLHRFSFEGPLKKEKSSFFVSWRRTNFEWLYKKIAPNLDLYFSDFNVKWNSKINNNNRIYFTLFQGKDVLGNVALSSQVAGLGWTNFTSTLRWNHIFSQKLFSNTILYTGAYQYKLFAGQNTWDSGIGNLSFKMNFTYYHKPKWTSKFGSELHTYAFNPGKLFIKSIDSFFPTFRQNKSRQAVLYYNSDYKLNTKWQFTLGARLSNWGNVGPGFYPVFDDQYNPVDTIAVGGGVYQRYLNINPRLSLKYNFDSTVFLKLSAGIYHQYMHLISNSTSPFTSLEVWLPSNPNIKPQRADQISLGLVKYFPKQKIELSTELYYKKMSHQIDYKAHANTLLNPLLEGELRFGKMKAYGVEFMLKKDFGRLDGWISYTYSRALRQTKDVNQGREYPAFQDRPHDLSILLNYQLKPRILFSANWTYYTGSAFSSPTGFYTFNNYTVPIYGEKNNDRLPNYRRMDIAFKFILNKNPENRFQHSLTFSLYNAFAHKNIVAVNFNKILSPTDKPVVQADFSQKQNLVATQAELVRFLPSLTYKIKI